MRGVRPQTIVEKGFRLHAGVGVVASAASGKSLRSALRMGISAGTMRCCILPLNSMLAVSSSSSREEHESTCVSEHTDGKRAAGKGEWGGCVCL